MNNPNSPLAYVKRLWLGPVIGLFIAGFTSYYLAQNDEKQDQLESQISTNVENLTEPLVGWASLVTSILLPAGDVWLFIALVIISVSGCQWFVGVWRSLLALIGGNVVATLIVLPFLVNGINRGIYPTDLSSEDDYGVSYALLSILACTSLLPRVWWAKTLWALVTIGVLVVFTATSWGTYVMWGHFVAAAFGLLLGLIYRRTVLREVATS